MQREGGIQTLAHEPDRGGRIGVEVARTRLDADASAEANLTQRLEEGSVVVLPP